LATVVIGGLVTATFLTLVLLPVLYMWFEKRQQRKIKPAAIIILVLLGSLQVEAQSIQGNKISLDSLLQMAGRQNLSVQANRKNSQYWQSLSQKTFELPRTQVGLEYGNINSANQDTRFFVSQGFQMPAVYRRHKDFYQANIEANTALLALKEKELAKEIRLSYYSLQGLMERDSLLQFLDSVYSRFASGAELRLKTGETGMLEKTTATALVQHLKLQRKQLHADFLVQQHRLGMLLNSDDRWLPLNFNDLETGLYLTDTAVMSAHPMVQYWDGQSRLIQTQTEVDRSRLSPEFSLGYSNLSIIGYQTEDGVNQKYYGSGDRFNIYQFSMGLPLFNGATRSRIKAAQISADINKIEKENAYKHVSGQLKIGQEEYLKHAEAVKYYTETGLLQADQIIKNAGKSFQSGDLSYMEWTMLMNQAVQIKLSYLDALQALRKTEAELIYLTGK
jgi:cobalt-zinc-cadmium resistance protein CzcA